MKKAYVLLFDEYADWEIGNILAEFHRLAKVEVVSVGFSDKTIVSMGGLRVIPDMAMSEMDINDVLIFIIPGGYMWEKGYPAEELERLLCELEKAKVPIAAICAATTVLARAGLFKGRKHTSNSLKYLSKMVPEYKEDQHYMDVIATRDQAIITASGLGPVDFAKEILEELDLATPAIRKVWYDAFKYGNYLEH
ncbi:MAG: DJ-1/PfpI family protein [Desulfobacterales bacterium]|nr:DJ-1/PfpI family protein [Desulfobacterales bacterium]